MPRSKHAERAVLKAVKARLLPPHWLEAGAEWLIEQLPRQFLRVTSTPLKQLAAFPDASDCWLSEGSEPLFGWRVEPIWERGWYYLEMALVRHNGSRYARLQFAGGTDEEWASVPVSTNFRGSVRRRCRTSTRKRFRKGILRPPRGCPGFCVNGLSFKPATADLQTQ